VLESGAQRRRLWRRGGRPDPVRLARHAGRRRAIRRAGPGMSPIRSMHTRVACGPPRALREIAAPW
jgi:hypothetical protein